MAYEYVVLDEEPVEAIPGRWARIPVWWKDVEAFGEVFVWGDGTLDISIYDPRFRVDDMMAPIIAPLRNWKRIVGVVR